MLVLSRKRGQKIRIGHDVTVQLLDIRGDKIRFGIEAPRHVEVHREEIYDKVHGNQPAAPAQVKGDS